MDRRKFIKQSGAAVATSLLPWKLNAAFSDITTVWEMEGKAVPAVSGLFEALGGIQSYFPDGIENATVLLKPNLCLPQPEETGTTTASGLMDALCAFFSDAGAGKIIIADHTLQKPENFSDHAIVKLAEKYPSVKCILAGEQRYYSPTDIDGKVLKSTELLKILNKVDLFINVATAKHHSAAQVSLAIKNLMGVIWDRSVFHTQLDMSQALGDLALAVKPNLNIVDCNWILLNGGPTGPGPVSEDKRFFASSDIVAVDAVVTSRYNFGGRSVDPMDIEHLYSAYENGVGEIELNKIDIQKVIV